MTPVEQALNDLPDEFLSYEYGGDTQTLEVIHYDDEVRIYYNGDTQYADTFVDEHLAVLAAIHQRREAVRKQHKENP